jgi:hypothetical protein
MASAGFILYDGAPVSTTSDLGKELVKWETTNRIPGWRPENNPFPQMMYKASHRPDGKRSVHEVYDHLFATTDSEGRRIIPEGAAEAFNRRCQLTVQDEQGRQRALEQGWRPTPGEAMEFAEGRDNAISTATAERHFHDARMSPQAQAEAAVVDNASLKMVPSIPEQPRQKRKYTRKPKPDQAA